MYRIENKYIEYGISYGILVFLIFSLLSSIASAEQYDHNNTGNRTCRECHSNVHQQYNNSYNMTQGQIHNNLYNEQIKNTNIIAANIAATEVIGNIILIPSMGQNWYQQGIYGPSGYNTVVDQSWGWTFWDENPQSGFIIPSEKVIQRDNIYALLLDDGNNSNPISGAQVTANVTYWIYNGTNYDNNISKIQLTEDVNRRGFYSGRFDFYGGTTHSSEGDMMQCVGCHLTDFIGVVDTKTGYFPGNYTVLIRAEADNKIMTKNINFEVTPWGCEDCHGSGNRHRATSPDRHVVSADMDSACYLCHSVGEITGMYEAGNPHQNPAHRNINCADCHTNKNINSQTFNGVTFINGGINNAPIPQYNHGAIELNRGTHTSLSCEDCHGNLILSNPQGGYNPNSYIINDVINKYPNFASLESFQDYYVINVTGDVPLNPLDISFDWEGSANLGFYLYSPNYNPRNYTALPYSGGPTHVSKPERYTGNLPTAGKWILQIYGFDKFDDPAAWAWNGTLQLPINYTISSTYPLEKKNLPSTPECNNCHNSGGTGGAQTNYEIPNWNPGFAHADTNGDGNLDIQCRLCHNTLHDIGTKTCQNCHTTPPTGHFIQEPKFSQYNVSQCLQCHGDPHRVTTGGGSCIACHQNDVNISKFGRHANLNISDGAGVVSDKDCWTCHRNKDMNKNNIYLCESCHINSTGVVSVNDPALIISDFSHGNQQCKSCHAPVKYHMHGAVGPKGLMEFFNFN